MDTGKDITGTERTFAASYVPDEDIIRYNRVSKVYGFSVGDYARVTGTNYEDTLSREEERERLVSPTHKQKTVEPTFAPEMSNSGENNHGDERAAGEEIELDLSS